MSLRLPNTDLDVSPLCLGTGELGTTVAGEAAFALLDAFTEGGGTFVDTAHNYGDWVSDAPRGASEKILGAWMRARNNRDRVVLATKGAHWHLDSPDVPRLSRRDIEEDLDGSLQNLGTDRIDLYWLHRDDPNRPVGDILHVLNDARQAGKVRWFGASNWRTERLREAQAHAQAHGLAGFVADQVLWNAAVLAGPPYGDPTTGWMDAERFRFHQETGMAVLAYQSQAYGLFHRMAAGTLDAMNPGFRGFYKLEESARRFAGIRAVMAGIGLSVTQVVLGYLSSQPFPTVPIVGCRSVAQLRDSLSARDVRLTPEQIAVIEKEPSP